MGRIPTSLRTRAAARIVTGPPGHLWGSLADWATLLARYARARARGEPMDWSRPLSR